MSMKNGLKYFLPSLLVISVVIGSLGVAIAIEELLHPELPQYFPAV